MYALSVNLFMRAPSATAMARNRKEPEQTAERRLGLRICAARKAAGLTQASLAEEADVSTETISRLERVLYDPALSTLVAIADVLEVDLDYVAGRHDDGQPTPSRLRRLVEAASRLEPKAQRALTQFLGELPGGSKGARRTRRTKR